jgi:hypothetical protein
VAMQYLGCFALTAGEKYREECFPEEWVLLGQAQSGRFSLRAALGTVYLVPSSSHSDTLESPGEVVQNDNTWALSPRVSTSETLKGLTHQCRQVGRSAFLEHLGVHRKQKTCAHP